MKFSIKKPSIDTEFNVQAYVYNELKKLGFDVHGEVKAQYEGRKVSRFDLVIFQSDLPVAIIEIKKSPINHKTRWENTRQGRKYFDYGVPVIILYGMVDAKDFIESKKYTTIISC